MPTYSLTVNGQRRSVTAEADTPLLWILRENLSLPGTKFGCGGGYCGACTVHMGDAAIRSCQMPINAAAGQRITTIEGLSADGTHAVQRAWVEEDVVQCGYCQPGQLMSAAALLAAKPNPTDADIDEAMSGNICRCGTYQRVRAAIHRAAGHPAPAGNGGEA